MSKLREAAQKLIDQGYQPIQLMFDISENIYWGLGFKKGGESFDSWHPYKGHRELHKYGAYMVTYSFDEELSGMNCAGTLIYIEPDPDDYEEGEELPEVNQEDLWYECDIKDLINAWEDCDHGEEILAKLEAIADGPAGNHWTDIRTDQ